MTSIEQAYCPERFRRQGHSVVDMLADNLHQTISGQQDDVVEMIDPDTAMQEIETLFERLANSKGEGIEQLFAGVYQRTIRLHHPRYLGHQISPPLPAAALASLLSDLLNNGMGVYEMGIAGTAIERFVIKSLSRKFQFGDQADGFFTSGGTLGNLTALLAARRAKAQDDVWTDGTKKRLALMVSEQAHYCIDKAVRAMGWGSDGIILIPTRDDYSMDTCALETRLASANRQGLEVVAIVASACSTATGSFDDLEEIATFCQKHDLWFHVDGAHGAATVYSDEFRYRVNGIGLADSVTMDFHKLLMTPALATAVVFKDGRYGAQNFAQKADYLWSDSNPEDQWHDLARRTFECTKSMVALKVFTILALYGESIFQENVTTLYRSAMSFAELINDQPDFELATLPQSNIVCFRIVPPGTNKDLDKLNLAVRAKLIADGKFYIVQTTLDGKSWLRCTVANPFTTGNQFHQLLGSIRQIAKSVA